MEKLKAERVTYQALLNKTSYRRPYVVALGSCRGLGRPGILEGLNKMPETIFRWVFTLACLLAFLFSYGMVKGDNKSTTSEFGYRLFRLRLRLAYEG